MSYIQAARSIGVVVKGEATCIERGKNPAMVNYHSLVSVSITCSPVVIQFACQ